MLTTLGARGEVAGACLGTLSLLEGIPWAGLACLESYYGAAFHTTKLYRLLCELGIRGLLPFGTGGDVLSPLLFPFTPGRWLLDLDW